MATLVVGDPDEGSKQATKQTSNKIRIGSIFEYFLSKGMSLKKSYLLWLECLLLLREFSRLASDGPAPSAVFVVVTILAIPRVRRLLPFATHPQIPKGSPKMVDKMCIFEERPM